MPTDALAAYATVILLLPMAFLPVVADLSAGRTEVPEVTQLLRGMFNGYFLAMSVTGTVAAVMFAVAGRPVFTVAAIAAAAFAVAARRWFLPRLDAELQMRTPASPQRCHGCASCTSKAC